MNSTSQISLTPKLLIPAAHYLRNQLRQSDADAAALCTLDGQCAWASDAAFQTLAPSVARIGIASLRLWVKARTGKLEQIGLVTDDGVVDIIVVPPLASLLVISRRGEARGWPKGEPEMLLQAIGLAQ